MFVPSKGIPFLAAKLQSWNNSVPKQGGSLTQVGAGEGVGGFALGEYVCCYSPGSGCP